MVRSIAHARELLEYVLKETERLNAMIVKQTRHCAELKAWEEAAKRAARHSAASKQRFFSAPLLDALRETIALFPAPQFFSSLRFSYKRWTPWTRLRT